MLLGIKKYAQILFALFFCFFFLTSYFGVATMDMRMSHDGTMASGCPFMPDMATLCQMQPLEHIAAWQSAFEATPNLHTALAVLLLLLSCVFTAVSLCPRPIPQLRKVLLHTSAHTYYRRQIPIAHPLQEAFSNGILHPKLF